MKLAFEEKRRDLEEQMRSLDGKESLLNGEFGEIIDDLETLVGTVGDRCKALLSTITNQTSFLYTPLIQTHH